MFVHDTLNADKQNRCVSIFDTFQFGRRRKARIMHFYTACVINEMRIFFEQHEQNKKKKLCRNSNLSFEHGVVVSEQRK